MTGQNRGKGNQRDRKEQPVVINDHISASAFWGFSCVTGRSLT